MERKQNHLHLLALYIALKPLYLRQSGSLQLSDVILLVGLLNLIIRHRYKITILESEAKLIRLFGTICIYQLLINTIWSVALGRSLFKPLLYYAFNLLVILTVLIILQKRSVEESAHYILLGCLLSLIITMIGLILRFGTTAREQGFFNNPNQLGYYALLVFSIFLLFFDRASLFVRVSISVMSTWAIIASSSKAALISMGILVFMRILFDPNQRGTSKRVIFMRVLLLLLFVAVVYLILYSKNSIILSNKTIMFVRRRLETYGQERDSSLGTGRGYNRIFEMGIHFLWGMGEGAFYRFQTLTGLESHSNYVTLLVSYGVIGFSGYIYLFWNIIKGHPRRNLINLSGALFYGLTHNGLRNTLLWVLLTLVLFLDRSADEAKLDVVPSSKLPSQHQSHVAIMAIDTQERGK